VDDELLRNLLRWLWVDPVWSKVIATGIVAAVGGIVIGEWWSESLAVLLAVWKFLGAATPMANWLLGILILSALAAVGLGIVLIYALLLSTREAAAGPSFRDYNEDRFHFLDLRWRWSYSSDGYPIEIASFCPTCDLQIMPRPSSAYAAADGVTFHCDNCGGYDRTLAMSLDEIVSMVIRQIQRKLRNGSWKDFVRAS
jgi:hypothetical protein